MTLTVSPEVIAALQTDGDKEQGWLLMGTNELIEAAVAAGQGDLSSVTIDRVSAFREVRKLREQNPALAIVGFAHSHPTGHSEPSVFDFRGDSRWVAELPGRAGIFGIVACGVVRWFHLAVGDKWYREVTPCPG